MNGISTIKETMAKLQCFLIRNELFSMIGASDDDRNIRLLFLADAELIVDDNDVKALCYKL